MKRLIWGVVVCLAPALACAQSDEEKAARAIVEKATKAMGGKDKLDKAKGLTWKGVGKADEGGMTATITQAWTVLEDDKYRLEANVDAGGMAHTMVMVIDGKKGWMQANGMTMDAPDEIIETMTGAFNPVRLVQRMTPLLDAKVCTLSPLGEVKVNDKATQGVRVARKDKGDVNVYFDKTTSLPAKIELRIKEPGGNEVGIEMFLSEFREFDGIKFPTKIEFNREGKKVFETDATEVKAHEKLDASLFAKP